MILFFACSSSPTLTDTSTSKDAVQDTSIINTDESDLNAEIDSIIKSELSHF